MSVLFLFILCIAYVAMIGRFAYGFEKVPEFRSFHRAPATRFCLVIPFRNESQALPNLLACLKELDYPADLTECIFVDDASEDDSVAIIGSFALPFTVSIIANERRTASPKKDAIVTAIEKTGMDWIITTDADCTMGKDWLRAYDGFIQDEQPDFVAAPVGVPGRSDLWHSLQLMEHMALQGATIGGFGIGRPFLCNGANMAYTKQLFRELNGYLGNEDVASGDDVFLLHKAVSARKKTAFLKSKDAIVCTAMAADFDTYVQQRVRWARKSSGYRSRFAKVVAAVVFLGNFMLAVAVLGILRPSRFFGHFDSLAVGYFFAFKCIADYILITKTRRFFGVYTYHFFSASLIYPFVSSFVALRSLFGGYRWKGRRFNR